MSLENLLIVPIDEIDEQLINNLSYKLGNVFKLNIRIKKWNTISEIPRSEFKFRSMYRSTELLNYFSENALEKNCKILFIADHDLYSPVFSKFYGEAQLNGKTGILSLFHLKEENRNRIINKQILLSRVEKEAIHEVGHLFGLIHCREKNCVMHLSSTINDIDVKSSLFCNHCIDVFKYSTHGV